jgi:hypothetical protein
LFLVLVFFILFGNLTEQTLVKQQGKEETSKPNPIKNRKRSNFIEGSKVEGKTWNCHQGRKSTSTLHFIFYFLINEKVALSNWNLGTKAFFCRNVAPR